MEGRCHAVRPSAPVETGVMDDFIKVSYSIVIIKTFITYFFLHELMICVIALIVFGILGIFSASHRLIAKEAFECVFRRITLRKCETGLDKRLKAQITGKLMKRFPKTGKQVYKHFELLSWIFLILLLASIFFAGQGIYNAAVYGNCYGPGSTEFCPLSPGTDHSTIRAATTLKPELVSYEDDPWFGNPNASTKIVMFGCFKCPYTKEAAEEIVKELYYDQEDTYFVYKDFPLSVHEHSLEPAYAAECVYEQDRQLYWDYYFQLFENQEQLDNATLVGLAEPLGLNMTRFVECFESQKYLEEVRTDHDEGFEAGVYGTPTFFINGNKSIVGPKEKEFNKAIN